MRQILTLLFVIISSTVFSQIKSKSLEGNWITSNEDSLYYKADEIILHQNINYTNENKDCHYVNGKISGRKNIKIENIFSCTEPGRVSSNTNKETFDLKCEDDNQVIIIKRKGLEIDRFLIISLTEEEIDQYPHSVKKLTLKRL